MNEQALDDELAKPEYAGLADQQAADAINAKTVSVRVPVETGDLKFAMIGAGIWERLEAAAPPGSNDPPASQARTLMSACNSSRAIDLDDPRVDTLVQQCVTHDLMSQTEVDALNTLADQVVPWVSTNGVGEVGIGAVINSRRRIGAIGNA
jgi:hypothetical protein